MTRKRRGNDNFQEPHKNSNTFFINAFVNSLMGVTITFKLENFEVLSYCTVKTKLVDKLVS